MARSIRAMLPLFRRRYLNRCAQVASASCSPCSSSSSSSSSLLRSSRNRFLTSEEQQMRKMQQQFGRRRKRQYFVFPPDVFEALPLFAEFRMVERSIISDEEERREKRHKQREKQRLMRRYYQALELQRDSVVNEVLLMVRPNLLLSPTPIDESIKRPGMSGNAAKNEGDDKEDGKEEKEVNNSLNENGNSEEVEGDEDSTKDEDQEVILEDSTNNSKEASSKAKIIK
ncbi:uncharacterized protein MONOS_16166 [Monocercomonoides exilis]|uniref:uncharacterized protein n=1 Tax=Monocercomonoides exilis TaxID=2049356 RepID=UPI003559D1E2|nr:hypothetical protein MONOS_16166 [Monocercomonoides exilis]|eukprot:MONOS_16166.1-p1 / transcript=MONOS_16166.1 / gene=MONOS_16166 / organism=Monocercomonoides_exilis_PA203 / gene_product=unspecified product / transcript_product=unspecified product / location=Mono_scaffold01534:1807-2738(-) / protein_length=228 / sequence_SO=supercontig / SO=protein_coding / is_pseudo=false